MGAYCAAYWRERKFLNALITTDEFGNVWRWAGEGAARRATFVSGPRRER